MPIKEYEEDLETEHLRLSDTIFDTDSIRLWLNHPVKRFKPTDSRHNSDPLKPLYRRQSQADVLFNVEAVEVPAIDPANMMYIKQEAQNNADPYSYEYGDDKRENGPKVLEIA